MRSIILVALVAFAYGDVQLGQRTEEIQLDEFQSRLFEGAINKSAECIRNLLKSGDESIGLPPLDPFVLEDIAIDLDKYGWEHFKGQLELKSFKAEGQLGWHISKLKVSPTLIPIGAKVTLDLGWANANFVGDYNVNAEILDHSIEGAGQISGSAINFNLDIQLHGTLSRIGVKKLAIKPSLEDIEFNVGQLIIDGNDVSGTINSKVNNVLEVIQANMELIGEKLAEAILNILNKKIYSASMDTQMNSVIEAITNCIQIV